MITALLLAAALLIAPEPIERWSTVSTTPSGVHWEIERSTVGQTGDMAVAKVRATPASGPARTFNVFVQRSQCDKPRGDMMLTAEGYVETSVYVAGANTVDAALAAAVCSILRKPGLTL